MSNGRHMFTLGDLRRLREALAEYLKDHPFATGNELADFLNERKIIKRKWTRKAAQSFVLRNFGGLKQIRRAKEQAMILDRVAEQIKPQTFQRLESRHE